MKLNEIKNLEGILASAYEDVGKGGKYINTLWTGIYNSNHDLTFEETFKALIIVLRFLLKNKFITMHGYNDLRTKSEVNWEGDDEDFLTLLYEYVSNFSEKDTEKNPAFLDQFKYPIMKWHVSWPLNLSNYKY